jgi:hypothetical protein
VDFPEDGWPNKRTCFDGIEREEDTESKMDDHKSCGGASGDDGRETSMKSITVTVRRGKNRRWNSDHADIMSAAVAVPHHKLAESPNSRTIEINEWVITATTNPISNAFETDALHASLGFPLPEMTFGNNSLTLEHRLSQWKYRFDAGNALKAVKNGKLEEGDGGVKVGYADAWLKSRYATIRLLVSASF